ncbi:MAG: hypothetical protein AB1510_01545 [Bacillota bacterium]
MDDVIVMGLTAYITELLKKRGLKKEWVPLVVLTLAAVLNVANAAVFDPAIPWRKALKSGIMLGALASGIYGLGQATKEKKTRLRREDAGDPVATGDHDRTG